MDIGTSIGIAISLLGLLSALIGFIIRLSIKVGDTMSRMQALEKERDENSKKFEQFYNFKSETQLAIATMQANFNTIMNSLAEIKEELKTRKDNK